MEYLLDCGLNIESSFNNSPEPDESARIGRKI